MAFTAYDDETEPTLDPSIGEVQFRRVAWSKTDFSNTVIPSHQCSEEELGLSEEPSAKYMKPRKDSYDFVKLYRKKFQCIDEKDRFISGNFNTINTSNIMVLLVRCQGKDYCKSDEEITEFVRGKFLIVYVNEIRFES